MSRLPEILRIAAEAGGAEAVIGLVKAMGGKFVSIPLRVGPNHPLVVAGGRAAAEAIVKEFGASNVLFPKGHTRLLERILAVEVLAAGGSLNQAVAASGLSGRVICRIRKLMKDGKPVLPGDLAVTIRPRPRDARQMDIDDILGGASDTRQM